MFRLDSRVQVVLTVFLALLLPVGPVYAEISLRWSKAIGSRPNHIALAKDGESLYLSTGFPEGDLYQLDTEGTVRQERRVQGRYAGDFTLGEPGEIYFTKNTDAGDEWTVFRYDSNLTTQWKFADRTVFKNGSALSKQQNLYVGGESGTLYSITTGGKLRWNRQLEGRLVGSPVIGLEGKIYQASDAGHLYAFQPDGSLEWNISPDGSSLRFLSIGENGMIYLGSFDGGLYAISPHGDLLWENHIGANTATTDPVIDPDGNIIFTSRANQLISVDQDGNLNWIRSLPGNREDFFIRSTPVVAPSGNIYLGNFRGNNFGYVCVFSSEGELLEKRQLEGVRSHMLLTRAGHLYFTTGKKVYSFDVGESYNKEFSPWPSYQKNSQRTGQAEKFMPGTPIQSAIDSARDPVVNASIYLPNSRIVPGHDLVVIHVESLGNVELSSLLPSTVRLAGVSPAWHGRNESGYVFVFQSDTLGISRKDNSEKLKWKTVTMQFRGETKTDQRFHEKINLQVMSRN